MLESRDFEEQFDQRIAVETPYLVFCCYAHKDRAFLQDLKAHLKPLEHEGLIAIEDDIDVSPGMRWERDLTHHLEEADIILLLISSDFIASNYCFSEEMQRAMERHEQGSACVVPVIIRPAFWHKMPFGGLQALPEDATPISTAENKDIAFLSVVKGIRLVVQELAANTSSKGKPLRQRSVRGNSLPTSSQERNDMDTKDDSSQYIIKNKGPVGQQIIGGHQDQVISAETVYITNKQKNGIHALEAGARALLNKDYSSARKHLRIAIEELDEEQQKREAAKARYLQTLAILGNERPSEKGIVAMEKIYETLNAAISLEECGMYVMTRAVIREPSLRKQAGSTHITDYDKELLEYLERCQPDLCHQICRVFGI